MKKISEKRFLLDVNLLTSLLDVRHVLHSQAREWFREKDRPVATCPLTQLGLLRILTNTTATKWPIGFPGAQILLSSITDLTQHEFWPDDQTALAIDTHPIRAHNQWNDAYLLALARKRRGAVATFDRGMVELAGKNPELVELIR